MELEDKLNLAHQLKEQITLLERRCTLMTAEEEENWGMVEFTQQCDWYGFDLVTDKQKFSVIKAA